MRTHLHMAQLVVRICGPLIHVESPRLKTDLSGLWHPSPHEETQTYGPVSHCVSFSLLFHLMSGNMNSILVQPGNLKTV